MYYMHNNLSEMLTCEFQYEFSEVTWSVLQIFFFD